MFIHPSFAQETSSDVSGGEECAETRSLTSCPFFFFVWFVWHSVIPACILIHCQLLECHWFLFKQQDCSWAIVMASGRASHPWYPQGTPSIIFDLGGGECGFYTTAAIFPCSSFRNWICFQPVLYDRLMISFRGLRPQLLEPSQKFLSRLWSVKASKPFRVSHPQCYRMVLGGRATMQTALLLPSEMFNSMPQSRGRVRSTPQVPMWFIRNKQLSNQSGSRISKEQSSLLLCKPHL